MWISIDPGGKTTDPKRKSTAILIADNVYYGRGYKDFTFRLREKHIFSYADRDVIRSFIDPQTLDRIIIEDFLLDEKRALAQTGSRFETSKIIERITCICEQLDITHKIKIQRPGDRSSARTCPPEHEQFLRASKEPNAFKHFYASYQHLRFYLLSTHRNVCDLEPFHCPTCGYFLHGDSVECWNCNVKLNRKHEVRA